MSRHLPGSRISFVAQWEQVYQAGFSEQFWGQMLAPIALVLALSGFDKWPDAWWANWWLFNLSLTVVAGTLMTLWFLIGGIKDIKALFRSLTTIRRDDHDDGTVEK
jgi:hypothetical protein